MLRLLIFVLISALLAGCSSPASKSREKVVVVVDDEDAGLSDASGSADASTELPEETRDPDGPEFLELGITPELLTEGEAVAINAMVTDPQGFEDIGGGRVIDEEGRVYATFSGSGGSYTATLSWSIIDSVEPISFEGSEERVFLAEFFDAANLRSTRAFAVTLHCDGLPACDGTCGSTVCTEACAEAGAECTPGECADPFVLPPLNTRDNCGACGNACGSGKDCVDGSCECVGAMCDGVCTDLSSDPHHCGTCGTGCGTHQICDEGTCVEGAVPFTACETSDDCYQDGSCYETEFGKHCAYLCFEDTDCMGEASCIAIPEYGISYCAIRCTGDADCPQAQSCINPYQETGRPEMPDEDICAPYRP